MCVCVRAWSGYRGKIPVRKLVKYCIIHTGVGAHFPPMFQFAYPRHKESFIFRYIFPQLTSWLFLAESSEDVLQPQSQECSRFGWICLKLTQTPGSCYAFGQLSNVYVSAIAVRVLLHGWLLRFAAAGIDWCLQIAAVTKPVQCNDRLSVTAAVVHDCQRLPGVIVAGCIICGHRQSVIRLYRLRVCQVGIRRFF